MRFERVDDWLQWQQTLHPRAIDPGLERVREVAARLGLLNPPARVITVAGTNGKGTAVAALEGIARAHGARPGVYTSPHLLAYNERIRLDGRDVDDDRLLAAFDAIDRARGECSLSYFEFGTLAAFWCFRDAGCDPWVLEVGLGGRLDAVNVLDADVAVVTSVDIDHADWLGPDRDTIALEKAGVMRPNRPAVCADTQPPVTLLRHVEALPVPLRRIGRDFHVDSTPDRWHYRDHAGEVTDMPLTGAGGSLPANVAAAIAAWSAVPGVDRRADAVRAGVAAMHLRARLEMLDDDWMVDVAHNVAAAGALARNLEARHAGRRREAVFALMGRKDLAAVVSSLVPTIERWHLLTLPDDDVWPVDDMAAAIADAGGRVGEIGPPQTLFDRVDAVAGPAVRVAFGSFRVAEETLRWFPHRSPASVAAVPRPAVAAGTQPERMESCSKP